MADGTLGGLASPASAGPSPERLAAFDLNDLGNAKRLILLAGGEVEDETGDVLTANVRLLFLLGAGWVGYDDRRGVWDREMGDELARRLAHRVAHKLKGLWVDLLAAHKMTDAQLFKFIDSVGQAGSTSAMLKQAQSYLTVKIEVFDQDPWLLNCLNGTLELRDRAGGFAPRLRSHDPADRITRQAAVRYDPAAEAPLFARVLQASLPEKEEQGFFHRWLGYGSTGLIHEQAFVLTQGRGRDGKSTLLDACREALGSYGEVGNVATFLEAGPQNATGPDPELVKLSGDVRLVVLSEPPRGSKLNEGRLKAWTSGSPISARDLHGKPFSWRPRGKLTFECNAFPVARGDDEGIWRRIFTPLFRHQVAPADIDRSLPDRIRAGELPGVLNWLVAGVGDWMARGLDPPASLQAVQDEYRKSSSPFGDWLAAECVWGEAAAGERTLSGTLYANYKLWCEGEGIEKPMSTTSFGNALRDRQVLFAGKDRDGKKLRSPIRLKTDPERDQDAASAGGGLGSGARPAPAAPPAGGFDLPPDEAGDGQ